MPSGGDAEMNVVPAVITWSDRLAQELISLKKGLMPTARGAGKNRDVPGWQPVGDIEHCVTVDDLTLIGLRSLSHSLWRSIEVNVVRAVASSFARPILDLGCGDGLFGHVAVGRMECGVDIDSSPRLRAALDAGGVYDRVEIVNPGAGFPFESETFATVFSNSVLEHVTEIDGLLKEVARILRPGGQIVFTVPTANFLEHLTRQFGATDAEWFNAQLGHINLWSVEEWRSRLASVNMPLLRAQEYFSPRACYCYRTFANQWVFRLERLFRGGVVPVLQRPLLALVRESLDLQSGACALIMGQKAM